MSVLPAAGAVAANFAELFVEVLWVEDWRVELVQAQRPNDAGLIGAAALFHTASII